LSFHTKSGFSPQKLEDNGTGPKTDVSGKLRQVCAETGASAQKQQNVDHFAWTVQQAAGLVNESIIILAHDGPAFQAVWKSRVQALWNPACSIIISKRGTP
jgi:hypothetical protein